MPNDLATFPQSINVAFPTSGTGTPASGFYTVNVTLASLTLSQFVNITGSPWSHLLHRYEKANYTQAASTATIGSGGSGYTVNDILTLGGGSFTTAAQFKVTAVAAGVVSTVVLQTAGSYTSLPTNPVSTTGGTGTGCTLNVTWAAGSLMNGATLLSLATQIVKDWYLWQLAGLDQYFVGIANWTPEGLQDIEWRQQSGRITTHVQRRSFNPQEDLLQVPAATSGAAGPVGPTGPAGTIITGVGVINSIPVFRDEEAEHYWFPPFSLNFPIIISQGGTSATTAVGAHDNLSTLSTAIASALTTDLQTATGTYVHITGTNTITSFGGVTLAAGVERTLVFDGVLIVANNANILLPGGANFVTTAGDTMIVRYEGASVWRVVSPTVLPRYLATIYTSTGAHTFSKQPWARRIRRTVVGAGGGGGGSAAPDGVTNCSASGGGGGGGTSIYEGPASELAASETATVGTGGAGGAAGSNDGADGTASTFTTAAGPGLLTGSGGAGGQHGTPTTSWAIANGGAGGAAATNANLNMRGGDATYGFVISGQVSRIGGFGGSSYLTGQKKCLGDQQGSDAPVHSGGGGSGVMLVGAVAQRGGNGADGYILVEEFS